MKNVLLISTRKGLIVCEPFADQWKITSSFFEGIPVTFSYEDPRNGAWWVGLDHGHWGVKLQRSFDKGLTWEEIVAPAFQEGQMVKEGVQATVSYIWCIHHGGKKHPERMWVGTVPGGLFETNDYGKSWKLNSGLWDHPSRENQWFGGGFDYPGIHSINLDPRDENIIQIGISCAGVLESKDNGKTWAGKNSGLLAEYLPNPNVEFGHDPHLLVRAPSNPDILWQQNHCGIFYSGNNGLSWTKVSEDGGPAHFGFPIAVADDNADQAWVAPALSDEKRIPIRNSLCISRTDDGGKSWIQLRNGLPQEFSFDIVYRHALVAEGNNVFFGTTTGNVFYSLNRGNHWNVLSNHLPMVHAIGLAHKE